MSNVKVVPRSLTDAYKRREGDFSPDLVGLQFTSGDAFFTFGNFNVTTNVSPRLSKDFILGGEWSEYYNLENLNLSQSDSITLETNDLNIFLNFDPNNISRYVYFGSFYELIRVTLEQIIQKWKGSIYLNPLSKTNIAVNTVLSFQYDQINGVASFLIPKSVISNPFELIVDDNQDFVDLKPDEIFNLSRDYSKYVIEINGNQFPVVGYTGSTTNYSYIRVNTKGNPFTQLSGSTFGSLTYHLKPNNNEVNLFFEELTDFENLILNRMTVPQYTCSFSVPSEVDGFIFNSNKNFTWPVSDGYNIDINTRDYETYVNSILETANQFDLYKTDLMVRRFVSESINEYDTDGGGQEIYGRKVNKLLKIYGREFDEVKKYIDGISFANVVTYDKLDNTADELIKIMAKTLGFDVLLTVGTDNFNLKEITDKPLTTVFSGQSMGLSTKELDIELWRRLVINAWWLWKSKGTRKVIEFFFSLFNIPQCMLSLNEFVYLAENRLNTVEIYEILANLYGGIENVDLTTIPMDDFGFPSKLPETIINYFQMDGFWYNGGSENTIGNNPHIGPYDYGKKYFNQYECFIDSTVLQGLRNTTVTIPKTENLFNNYNKGTFSVDTESGLPIPYYGSDYANTLNNNGQINNATVTSAGLTEPKTIYAPPIEQEGSQTFMGLTFETNSDVCNLCPEIFYGEDGIVYNLNDKKPITDEKCCMGTWLASAPTETTPPIVCPPSKDVLVNQNDRLVKAIINCYSNTSLTLEQKDTCYNQVYTQYGSNPPCAVGMVSGQSIIGIPKDCCNKDNLGFDVYWDGSFCYQKECYVKLQTGLNCSDNLIITSDSIKCQASKLLECVDCDSEFVYQSANLFREQPNKNLELIDLVNSYTCYWCQPENYITKICDARSFVNGLTQQEINDLYIKIFGPIGEASDSIIKEKVNNALTSSIKNYGCLLISKNGEFIVDNNCCKLRGGNYVNGYCFKPQDDPCNTAQVNSSHVFVDDKGNLLSQNCCTKYGSWTFGSINIVSNGTILTDSLGSSFANSLGEKYYCSACPQNITIYNGTEVRDNSTNQSLTPQCCVDYGYEWNGTICVVKTPTDGGGTGIDTGGNTTAGEAELCLKDCIITYEPTGTKCEDALLQLLEMNRILVKGWGCLQKVYEEQTYYQLTNNPLYRNKIYNFNNTTFKTVDELIDLLNNMLQTYYNYLEDYIPNATFPNDIKNNGAFTCDITIMNSFYNDYTVAGLNEFCSIDVFTSYAGNLLPVDDPINDGWDYVEAIDYLLGLNSSGSWVVLKSNEQIPTVPLTNTNQNCVVPTYDELILQPYFPISNG